MTGRQVHNTLNPNVILVPVVYMTPVNIWRSLFLVVTISQAVESSTSPCLAVESCSRSWPVLASLCSRKRSTIMCCMPSVELLRQRSQVLCDVKNISQSLRKLRSWNLYLHSRDSNKLSSSPDTKTSLPNRGINKIQEKFMVQHPNCHRASPKCEKCEEIAR